MRFIKQNHGNESEYILKIGRTTFELIKGLFEVVHKGKVVLSIEF